MGLAAERGREERTPTGLSRGRRFTELVRIARRNGLLPFRKLDFSTEPSRASLRATQAEGLRRALEEAGGAFVKMGQLLSTRTDLLPEEWAAALAHLQRNVAPAPWGEVEALLTRELGGPLDSVFASFEREPFAAASIGQVHRATLKSGREVAVKVQRPGIVPLMQRDIDIALRTTRVLSRTSVQMREMGIVQIAEQYAADLRRQLDFGLESVNLSALRTMQDRSPRAGEVRLPELIEVHTTERVVVMEYVEGVTLSALVGAGAAGAPAERADGIPVDHATLDRAMRAVLRAFVRQVVVDGVYHSDLHPGNIMIARDGRPVLVDFGSVGRLDLQLRETVQELLIAYLQGDTEQIADGVLAMAPLRPGADEAAFRRDLSAFITYRLGPGARVDVVVVDDLVDVFTGYGMAVPAEFVAAVRGAAILEGTLRTVLPEFDLLAEARGIASEQIGDQMRPEAVRELLTTELLGLLPSVRRIPRRVDRIGSALERGDLNVNIRLLADASDRRMLTGLVRRTVLAVSGGAAAAMSLVLLTVPPPEDAGVLTTADAGTAAGIGAIVLLLACAVDALRARRQR